LRKDDWRIKTFWLGGKFVTEDKAFVSVSDIAILHGVSSGGVCPEGNGKMVL